MLELQVRRRLGEFVLDAALTAPAREITVLVGESGAGKTTLLRLVAGLAHPDEGRITIEGRVLFDHASGVRLPPRARAVGYVGQEYTLFPHLTVRDNVAFGPRASGLPAAEVRTRTDAALARFALAPLARRRPAELSGGQQQRVAIARALVLDPRILLLDEPLSALDPATRRSVRIELRQMLTGLPCATLFVTHHPGDALAFGDQIAVLERGRVTQSGSRDAFVRHPRSAYVAEFLGLNLLEGEVLGAPSGGLVSVRVGETRLAIPDPGRSGAIRLLVHPREIVLSREAPSGSARNVLGGPVTEILPEPPGAEQVRVLLGTHPPLAAQVSRQSADLLGLAPGVWAYAAFKAAGVVVLPP